MSRRIKNIAQTDALLSEIAQLRKEKADLELLIQATIEHSDFVEEELIESVDTLETTKNPRLLLWTSKDCSF